MTEKTTPDYDKSKWAKGEWDNEPDRVDFIHAGFSCFLLRNHSGNWCGYVGVPSTHPLYKTHYQDVDMDVHGGLTYSNVCRPPICHVPEPGMPDDVWWFGFDTAHHMDIVPRFHSFGGVYRNVAYVTEETKNLADQLKACQ